MNPIDKNYATSGQCLLPPANNCVPDCPFHADHQPNSGWLPPTQLNQAPSQSSQDRYDSRICQMNVAKYGASGIAGGFASGAALGVKICPPSIFLPCASGFATGGAAFGGFAGGVAALQSEACQKITRTEQ